MLFSILIANVCVSKKELHLTAQGTFSSSPLVESSVELIFTKLWQPNKRSRFPQLWSSWLIMFYYSDMSRTQGEPGCACSVVHSSPGKLHHVIFPGWTYFLLYLCYKATKISFNLGSENFRSQIKKISSWSFFNHLKIYWGYFFNFLRPVCM